MAVSETERRKGAERLRHQLRYMRDRRPAYGKGGVEHDGNAAFRNIADSVKPLSNMSRHCYVETVERLADLIERPTCKDESVEKSVFVCSKCRCCAEVAEVVCNEHGEEFPLPLTPRYCPNCGAQVVRDA